MAAPVAEQLLTERQRTVVQGVAFRKSIKKIAAELDLSPSTVNEHIAAAKRRLNVSSTDELVAYYLSEMHESSTRGFNTGMENRVEQAAVFSQTSSQDDSGLYLMSDSFSMGSPMDMSFLREPQIVPEELDGQDAALPRLVMIAKLIGLLLAAVVLAILALQSVSDLLVQ